MPPNTHPTPGNKFTKPQARASAGAARKPGAALLGINPDGGVNVPPVLDGSAPRGFADGGLLAQENVGGAGYQTNQRALETYQSMNGADSPTAAPAAANTAPAMNRPIDGSLLHGGDFKLPVAYADGGIIGSIANMFHRKTQAERVAEMSAQTNAGIAAKKAAANAPDLAPAAVAKNTPAPMGSQSVIDARMKAAGMRNGGKIKGPGTATSDSVAGKVQQTGEPIALSNGERIVSAAQEQTLQKIAKARGFESVDAMFEADTGKPVGPTVKGGKMGAATGTPPLDEQAASDRKAALGVWNSIKTGSRDAGAAIADIATLAPRGVVGAYDTAVVRPMRAAGVNAAYLSPKLVPNGVDPSSQTPFTDQYRMQDATAAQPGAAITGYASPTAAGVMQHQVGSAGTDVAPTPGSGGPKRSGAFANDAKVLPETVADSSTSPTTYANGQAMNVPGSVTQSDLIRADKAISAVMGDRTGGNANANMTRNVKNLTGNAGERDVYNDAQKLKGSNVRVMSDGKGGLLLTGAMGNDVATKSPYVGTDGAATGDYTKTSQYAQGVANAADTKRMGNDLERQRLELEAGSALKGYSVPAMARLEQIRKNAESANAAATGATNMENTRANTAGTLLKNSEGAQMAALRKSLMDEQDPDKRAVIEEQLRAISGRQLTPRFSHITGGSHVDPATQQVVKDRDSIYDNQIGKIVNQDDPAATPSFADYKAHVVAKNKGANVTDAQLKAAYAKQFPGAK